MEALTATRLTFTSDNRKRTLTDLKDWSLNVQKDVFLFQSSDFFLSSVLNFFRLFSQKHKEWSFIYSYRFYWSYSDFVSSYSWLPPTPHHHMLIIPQSFRWRDGLRWSELKLQFLSSLFWTEHFKAGTSVDRCCCRVLLLRLQLFDGPSVWKRRGNAVIWMANGPLWAHRGAELMGGDVPLKPSSSYYI